MKAFIRILALLLAAALLPLCALAESAEDNEPIPLPDFSLADQYGRVWTKADLAGKRVFINVWTTWCPYCIQEMPDIQKLYEETGANEGDTVILGIDPLPEDSVDAKGAADFLAGMNLTYPVLMDEDGAFSSRLPIAGYPTTVIILPDGNFLGYVTGMIDYESMVTILDMALAQ